MKKLRHGEVKRLLRASQVAEMGFEVSPIYKMRVSDNAHQDHFCLGDCVMYGFCLLSICFLSSNNSTPIFDRTAQSWLSIKGERIPSLSQSQDHSQLTQWLGQACVWEPRPPDGSFLQDFCYNSLERGTLFPLEFLSPGCKLVAAEGHHRKSVYLEIKPINSAERRETKRCCNTIWAPRSNPAWSHNP